MTNIKLKQTSYERSDGIADFDVILLKDRITVDDLLKDVLSDNTWGKICFINDPSCADPQYADFDKREMIIEYSHGEVSNSKNTILFNEIQFMSINVVKAQGGYTRMDYYFTLKESVNV